MNTLNSYGASNRDMSGLKVPCIGFIMGWGGGYKNMAAKCIK